jgi:predicted transcriptional regulator
MTGFNQGFDLNSMLKTMEPSIERAVLRVLQPRVGRERAISRQSLLMSVHSYGFEVGDRSVRAVINRLRKDGFLICSTGGKNGGYWLASDWRELNEFLEKEVKPRALDLLETESALKSAARERWGPDAYQERLL